MTLSQHMGEQLLKLYSFAEYKWYTYIYIYSSWKTLWINAFLKIHPEGPKRWLRGWECILLLQKIQVWLTSACNFSSSEVSTILCWFPRALHPHTQAPCSLSLSLFRSLTLSQIKSLMIAFNRTNSEVCLYLVMCSLIFLNEYVFPCGYTTHFPCEFRSRLFSGLCKAFHSIW